MRAYGYSLRKKFMDIQNYYYYYKNNGKKRCVYGTYKYLIYETTNR